jgi:Uma2 family endonuclease
MGAKTLLTVEHLERLPETCEVSYELDQGELVEVSSASLRHNLLRGRILCRLLDYLDIHKKESVAIGNQWFALSEDTVRAPDVALISASQLALVEPERRVQPFSPALAIEIMSASNTIHDQARRIHEYLKAGTRSVWIFISAMPEILIYSAAAHPVILTAEDSLEDAALLPGFSARVEELFAV